MGPGLNAITGGEDVTKVAGWRIIREMLKHVWPRDQPRLKARVVVALTLLVGAKVCVCVCDIHVCDLFQHFDPLKTSCFMHVLFHVCVCVCVCA